MMKHLMMQILQKKAVMLLSMFHVSNPSRIYKNWLYAVLRWLFDNRDDIEQSDYINFFRKTLR